MPGVSEPAACMAARRLLLLVHPLVYSLVHASITQSLGTSWAPGPELDSGGPKVNRTTCGLTETETNGRLQNGKTKVGTESWGVQDKRLR